MDIPSPARPFLLDFLYEQGRLSVSERKSPAAFLPDIQGTVVVNGQLLTLSEAETAANWQERTLTLTSVFPSGLTWRRTLSPENGGVSLSSRLENHTNAPVTLGEWTVLQVENPAGGALTVGESLENARFFRWASWDMRVETLACAKSHFSDNLMHLYNPDAGRTLLCAFTTVTRMAGSHLLEASENGVTNYRAICRFGRFSLPAGGILDSETLHIGVYADPYEALEQWADDIHRRYKPSFAALPPVGWIGAWTKNEPQEAFTLKNAEAIRRLLPGFDISYLWTSQSSLKDYIPGNWMESHPAEFPNGLAPFFEKLIDLGFTPGLWISPFWFYGEAAETLAQCEEFLLRDENGAVLCEEECWGWRYPDEDRPCYHMHKYYLDGSHPLAASYINELFSHYNTLGVKYYMLDFLGTKEKAGLFDQTKTPLWAARNMLSTIRKAAGDDTHLQTAVSSTPGYVGIINAARVGRDFGESRALDGGLDGPLLNDWHNATHVLHDDHYANLFHFFQNAACNYFTDQKLYRNDLNVLTVDSPYPLEHARMAATLFGLCGGSPIMLGDDFTKISADRLRLVKLCLPRSNSSPKPLDLFENVYPESQCRLMALPVEKPWGRFDLVTVFNTDDASYSAQIDFARLGYEKGEAVRVYEFWNNEYCGTYADSFSVSVPQQTCRLFRLEKSRNHPWLLSTDLHIQQGALDVEALSWDEETMTLSGAVRRPKGEEGNLFFLMPRQYCLKNTEGVFLLKELLDMNVILRLPVKFESEVEHFSLSFAPWPLESVVPQGYFPYTYAKEWLAYKESHRKPGDTRVYQ